MKRGLLLTAAGLLIVLLIAVSSVVVLTRPPPLPAAQLFVNATVLTMDSEHTVASALLLRGDRIVAVGSEKALRAMAVDATVHDLQGATLIPGIVDAHGHFPGSGIGVLSADLSSPPVGDVLSINGLQQRLRDEVSLRNPDWVVGIGYDDTLLAEGRHPSRQDLDAAVADRPVFIMHVSGHMGVANSAALAAAGIDRDTEDPEGGVIVRDATGEPTGLLLELAAQPVQALAFDFGVLDFLTMTRHAAREYLEQGVTLAQSGGIDASMAKGLTLFSRLGFVPQRLELWPLADELGRELLEGRAQAADFETEKIRLGSIKFITDGSIQGFTGFLSHPYHTPYKGDVEYRGFPTISADKLAEKMLAFHRAGYRLALHGNGDAAIDAIIDGWQAALDEHTVADRRPIIIHAQMAREDQLQRMKALGMTPSFFSAHTYYWGDRHRERFMGPQRAARMSPTASSTAIGLRFSVHLDTPVVPMEPMLLLWSTVNRLSSSGKVIGAAQRISPEQALRAMTIDAAWQIHREQELGSLEAGKLADLVVLDTNPLAEGVNHLNIRVLKTFIGGREYYSASAQ